MNVVCHSGIWNRYENSYIMRSEIKMVGSHGWFTWFFFPQQYQTPIPNWKLRCGPVQQAFYTFLCCSCLQMRRPQSKLPVSQTFFCTHQPQICWSRPRLRQQQQEFVDLLIYGAILLTHGPFTLAINQHAENLNILNMFLCFILMFIQFSVTCSVYDLWW